MPSDPFEAELLMMAEAVASGGARGSDSDSEGSDDEPDNCKCRHYFPVFLLNNYNIPW